MSTGKKTPLILALHEG